MAKYGFDLQRKNKKRKTTALICLFIAFVILLGSVSTFLLWRSLNYDFNNIFVKNDEESTTSAPTTEKTDTLILHGDALFLVAVTSDDGKETRFINLIDVNLEEKTVRVIPFDHTKKSSNYKTTYEKILFENGVKELVVAVEGDRMVDIDRYVLFTDSGYKSVFRALGDVTVRVNRDIEYDTPDMFLELKRGENTIAPEKVFKYMKYICETEKGYECSRLNAEIIVSSFEAFYNIEKFSSADTLFSRLINYCKSDISIVDYTENKDEIEYLIPKTSKEKLKVYVSEKEIDDE
ncbi:MAG: LCP family protein [Acutalibacteraceae bacterium]|nr:LCP family protein [Acutalibacteraceae bacterium]